MIFKDFWVLALIPVVFFLLYLCKRKVKSSSLRFSSSGLISKHKPSVRLVLANNLVYLKAFAAVFFVLALARPQLPLEKIKVTSEGIGIVLAVDSSGSMRAMDFKIGRKRKNRLEVVKDVVDNFIRGRKYDRIGIVTFAARAYTVCPLTLDYSWLIKNMQRIKIGNIEDGTAIGSAINSSLNRLKESKAKSKLIILLTDGVNNAGKISPLAAAEAARALGVKIYTIGVGTRKAVPYPFQDLWGGTVYKKVKIELDQELLKKIAGVSGGKYFLATNTESLRNIYKQIDKMEKTEFEEPEYLDYRELFPGFVVAGLLLLLLDLFLANTILRKIP